MAEDCTTDLECEERAEINDLPPATRDHVLPRGLREQPHGFEIDVQHLLVSTPGKVSRFHRGVQGSV